MSAGRLFHAVLAGDTTLSALVTTTAGKKLIDAHRILQGQVGSKVTYTVDDAGVINTLDGNSGAAQPKITVECWAEKYDTAQAIADAVRNVVDTFTDNTTSGAIGALWRDDTNDGFMEPDFDEGEGLYHVAVNVTAWINA